MVLAHPRAKWLVERLVSMGRKCGIRLRLVSPDPLDRGTRQLLHDPPAARLHVGGVPAHRRRDHGRRVPEAAGRPAATEEQFPDGSKTFGLGYILGATGPRSSHLLPRR